MRGGPGRLPASVYAKKKDAAAPRLFFKQLPKDEKVLQALNRLTFGPRPGDAARVRSLGLKKWIDRQLHPERIAENPVLEEKLKTLDTLEMTSEELVRNYPTPQMVRQMVDGPLAVSHRPRAPHADREAGGSRAEAAGRATRAGDVPDVTPLASLLTPAQSAPCARALPQQRLAAFQALPAEKQEEVIAASAPGIAPGAFGDRPGRTAAQDRAGRRAAAGGGARPAGRQAAARHLQQPAARRGAGRFLVQPFQRLPGQRRGPLPGDRVRARRHPPARARQVPRPAGGHRQEPGHAVLPGQLAVGRCQRCRRRAGPPTGPAAA